MIFQPPKLWDASIHGLGIAALACAALNAACATGAAGHKSYILPAIEIVAMDAAVNLVARQVMDPAQYEVTPASIRRNLRGPWVIDDDPFEINQFLHPYQGAMYHGIARSNGLGYWPSVAYTFAGSAFWEIAGEKTPPARNDQIASGIAGSFLGEPLFRISRLLLDRADNGPGAWRMLASVLASPPAGVNHLLVGTPAGSRTMDAVPFSDIRVQFGATAIANGRSRSVSSLTVNQPRLALSMDYGYPGNASYRHKRPFDYFRIETSVSRQGIEQLSTRGLMAGADYGAGRVSGIWGMYGAYDYFAPDDFHVSSTSVSFGTTLQASIRDSLVVQSSGLLGAGFAAASTSALSSETDSAGTRDYHYGVAPQALANVRVIGGRRAALDITAREYVISSVGGFWTNQRNLIVVGDASLAIRVFSRHALGLTYQVAQRTSELFAVPDHTQARSTVGLFYTFLGSGGFGAVRDSAPGGSVNGSIGMR
ncbi:MAG TPA: DUF3943 domain-containing protein [Vicinamibacterales bacterium]|nr:DUF3943 domain-containing protein [Vicinamibacterales bacterium]